MAIKQYSLKKDGAKQLSPAFRVRMWQACLARVSFSAFVMMVLPYEPQKLQVYSRARHSSRCPIAL